MAEILAKVHHLLIYQVIREKLGIHTGSFFLPSQKPLRASPSPSAVAKKLAEAARASKKSWLTSLSTAERLITELLPEDKARPFSLRYYSIGNDDDHRISTVFLDEEPGGARLVSGAVDYPDTTPADRVAKFFALSRTDAQWVASKNSFRGHYHGRPRGILKEPDRTFFAVEVEGELAFYPNGLVCGGVPLGDEGVFLSVCDIEDAEPWRASVAELQPSLSLWNLICRSREPQRVFLLGEPGSGKELWSSAIRGGVRANFSGDWKTLAATIDERNLNVLLYGERSGNLESRGYLERCEGGGVFLDEIGKSSKEFRKNLLRVLESREFIPHGGTPLEFKRIFFVFASTAKDKADATEPPDFWTRMSFELSLPKPILLNPTSDATGKELSRLRSLLATFWFSDGLPPEQEKSAALKKQFAVKIFNPLVRSLRKLSRDQDEFQDLGVSPRRLRSLVQSLKASARWSSAYEDKRVRRREEFDSIVRGFLKSVAEDRKLSEAAT